MFGGLGFHWGLVLGCSCFSTPNSSSGRKYLIISSVKTIFVPRKDFLGIRKLFLEPGTIFGFEKNVPWTPEPDFCVKKSCWRFLTHTNAFKKVSGEPGLLFLCSEKPSGLPVDRFVSKKTPVVPGKAFWK